MTTLTDPTPSPGSTRRGFLDVAEPWRGGETTRCWRARCGSCNILNQRVISQALAEAKRAILALLLTEDPRPRCSRRSSLRRLQGSCARSTRAVSRGCARPPGSSRPCSGCRCGVRHGSPASVSAPTSMAGLGPRWPRGPAVGRATRPRRGGASVVSRASSIYTGSWPSCASWRGAIRASGSWWSVTAHTVMPRFKCSSPPRARWSRCQRCARGGASGRLASTGLLPGASSAIARPGFRRPGPRPGCSNAASRQCQWNIKGRSYMAGYLAACGQRAYGGITAHGDADGKRQEP